MWEYFLVVVCFLQTFIVSGNEIPIAIVPNIHFQNSQPPANVFENSFHSHGYLYLYLKEADEVLIFFDNRGKYHNKSATCHHNEGQQI